MDDKDFLSDDLFIYWRIHPTKELDVFWENFILENEGVEEPLNQAIQAFETIRKEQGLLHISQNPTRQKLNDAIKERKRKKRRNRVTSAAAAILLLAILSTLFILNEKPDGRQSGMASIGEVMGDSIVQLITGNQILEIDNNSTLNLSEKQLSAVIRNPLTQKKVDLNKNRINKLIVPYGKRSTLILADGSKVHLNSGTKMEFPTLFAGNRREITVEGEIFIEVAKQDNTPFTIHTPYSQITVYGTSFNVSSYAEEKSESVVLVNGSVEVKSQNSTLRLKPNEMANIENGVIRREQVNVSDYIGWTNGYIQFNKAPLDKVLKKIGRYYNIEFQYGYDLDLYNQTCSGKLFLSDNLQDVLEVFSKMTYLQYTQYGDGTIYIRR